MKGSRRKQFRLSPPQPANGGPLVLELDIEQLRAHLELINPRGEGYDGTFMFVALDDSKAKRKSSQIFGTLDECLPELIRAQSLGYGLFVIPHETAGRNAEDISRVLVLRFDYDNPRHFILAKRTWPKWLGISMVLITGRGVHVYCEAKRIAAMLDVKTWDRAQKQLTKMLGADTSASSIVQPFRLAGTWHLKGSPKFVRIRSLNYGTRFDAKDVLGHLPRETSDSPGEVFEELQGIPYPFPVLRSVLCKACSKIRNAKQGDRWPTIRSQVSHVARYIPFGLSKPLAWEALWNAIRSHEDPDLVKECLQMVGPTFEDGIRKGRLDPPTPPPSHRKKLDEKAWLERLVKKVGRDPITVRRVMARFRDWKHFGSEEEMERRIGRALRGDGRTAKVGKEKGKTVKIYSFPTEREPEGLSPYRGE